MRLIQTFTLLKPYFRNKCPLLSLICMLFINLFNLSMKSNKNAMHTKVVAISWRRRQTGVK